MGEYEAIIELGEVGEIPGHTQNALELFLVLRGHVEFTLDGSAYLLGENDLVLCNIGQVHSARGGGPNLTLRLQIPDSFIYQELGRSDYRFHCVCGEQLGADRPTDYEKLGQLLTRLMVVHYQKEPGYALRFKALLLQLLAFLLERFQMADLAVAPAGAGDLRIERIVAYIQANYREDVSLQELADREHISVPYLSRFFKKKMGLGFTEYLNQVRLSGAVNELLHTTDAIIKIALNNGFSNVSSFNRQFQKTYGQPPAKYRAKRQVRRQKHDTHSELRQAFQEESDLFSYLRRFEVRNRSGGGEPTEVWVDLQTAVKARWRPVEKIIRVGQMSELLKAEVQSQLKQLSEQLRIGAVHFQCLFGDGMTDYPSHVYNQYAYAQVMEFVLSLGVRPILSFSITEFLAGNKDAEAITSFLQQMRGRYNAAVVDDWQFEITYPDHMRTAVRRESYLAIWQAIRGVLPRAEIGLQHTQHHPQDGEYVQRYLRFLQNLGEAAPAFLSLCLELPPDDHFDQEEDYQRYRNYASRQLRRLVDCFQEAELPLPELKLLDWTTLSSQNQGASKTFFRAGLILAEILSCAPHVNAMAFWLNYYVEEAACGKRKTDSLAMYLLYHLKLPVYFAVQLLDFLYEQVIYETDQVLATRSKEGELAILIYHPCYFSPALAADRSYTEEKRQRFTLHLTSISGKTVIEQHHLDNQKTVLYGRWAAMGFPSVRDKGSIENLERTVNLEYSVLEEQAAGECTLSVTLAYNEATVFRLRRL